MDCIWPPSFLNPAKQVNVWHIFHVLVNIDFTVVVEITGLDHFVKLIWILFYLLDAPESLFGLAQNTSELPE